jgi:hypothetical protein
MGPGRREGRGYAASQPLRQCLVAARRAARRADPHQKPTTRERSISHVIHRMTCQPPSLGQRVIDTIRALGFPGCWLYQARRVGRLAVRYASWWPGQVAGSTLGDSI